MTYRLDPSKLDKRDIRSIGQLQTRLHKSIEIFCHSSEDLNVRVHHIYGELKYIDESDLLPEIQEAFKWVMNDIECGISNPTPQECKKLLSKIRDLSGRVDELLCRLTLWQMRRMNQ